MNVWQLLVKAVQKIGYALAIMRLIRSILRLKISGNIYEKRSSHIDDFNLQEIRKKISMIFQEPMTSLNPLHTIEKQITECFGINQKSNRSKCINLLNEVGIENPENRLSHYHISCQSRGKE